MTEEKYLTEKSLAKRWGIDFRTLQKWRCQGIGPPFIKIGIAVRYTPESIKKFEEEQMRSATNKSRFSHNKIPSTTKK
jgi:predicted site-specific integrase-resolvase